MPGRLLAVTPPATNGQQDAIVGDHDGRQDANQAVVPGVLRVFAASDVSKELWNSEQTSRRDSFGNHAKFNPPTVVNGKVYVPTFSNQVCVYGRLN